MKLMIFILTSFLTSSVFAERVFDRCWDSTYAYNTITLDVEKDVIKVMVSGANFDHVFSSSEGNIMMAYSLSLPRSECFVSKSKRIIECRKLKNIPVVFNSRGEEKRRIFSSLEFKIHFVEKVAGGLERKGFMLDLATEDLKVFGTKVKTHSEIIFVRCQNLPDTSKE